MDSLVLDVLQLPSLQEDHTTMFVVELLPIKREQQMVLMFA